MYGKIFQSMYEGSMAGAGPVVFAVWGYCISRADSDGTILLNPLVLAPIIGTTTEEIEKAITFLASPDPHSMNPDHEGRRLVNQTGYLYFLVSHHIYRAMKTAEDRREYMRNYMQIKRNSEAKKVNKVNKKLTQLTPASVSVYNSSSVLSSEEGSAEGGKRGKLEKFGEFGRVRLSSVEYDKLVAGHGKEKTDAGIAVLDAYIEQKGKRYKNHYACMNETSWVWEKVAKVVSKPVPAERPAPTAEELAAEREREAARLAEYNADQARIKKLARELGQ